MTALNEFVINVQGKSVLVRPAERAQLNLKVSSSEASKELASRNVLDTAQAIHAVLSDMNAKNEAGEPADDAPLTHFSMSSINNTTYSPRDSYNRLIDPVYTVTTSFEAKFKDFAKLGELAAKYSAVPFVDVTGVNWLLTEATQASLASHNRREAMRDAVRRAKDYAEAVGRTEVVPFEIDEASTYVGASGKAVQHAKRRQMMAQPGGYASGNPDNVQAPAYSNTGESAASNLPLGASLLVPEDVQLTHTITAKFKVL